MARNLRQALKNGKAIYGGACALGSPIVAEMMAMQGVDYLYIDQQHGLTSFDTMVSMLRAIDRTTTATLVRVLSNDAGLIGQALDAGADGVIVPMVNSRVEAESAVRACRYSPEGCRSFGPIRSGLTQGSDLQDANNRVLCAVMIETASGVANAYEIASVPGVDAVYIGQADLAISLGLRPTLQIETGAHAEAIKTIRDACQRAGIAAGISGNPSALKQAGYRMITINSDVSLFNSAIQDLRQLHEEANR